MSFFSRRDAQSMLNCITFRWLFSISKQEAPQPPWAMCASTLSLTQQRSAAWCSDGTYCVQFMPIVSSSGTGHH